jgi:hypothetical protein
MLLQTRGVRVGTQAAGLKNLYREALTLHDWKSHHKRAAPGMVYLSQEALNMRRQLLRPGLTIGMMMQKMWMSKCLGKTCPWAHLLCLEGRNGKRLLKQIVYLI